MNEISLITVKCNETKEVKDWFMGDKKMHAEIQFFSSVGERLAWAN